MNNIIWLVGAVVIVLFVAGFLGFRRRLHVERRGSPVKFEARLTCRVRSRRPLAIARGLNSSAQTR